MTLIAGRAPSPYSTFAASGLVDTDAPDEEYFLLERYANHGKRSRKLKAYYAFKPLLPRTVQIAIRRRYAQRQIRTSFPSWPIEPILVERRRQRILAQITASGDSSMRVLADWPEARSFAAILTHDVEGPAGIVNVPRLVAIEQRHGLVSSWNFVAEDYEIPQHLFKELRSAGCEIGSHGITHDGKLFADEASFMSQLPAIHRYLKQWAAVGFRSPATHRNPDWMPRLGCLYDSSFPDTDPFEPQAGGCCSILPFFINDLVELPITLVQDHTMWEILRYDSIDLWTHKSEWIIDNGGLINVIVHPDYLLSADRLQLYDQFCAYLRARLDACFGWHALPCEVASWWKVRRDLDDTMAGTHELTASVIKQAMSKRARMLNAAAQEGQVVRTDPQPLIEVVDAFDGV